MFPLASYSDFVKEQIKGVGVGEFRIVDVGEKDYHAFRMNLQKIAKSKGLKFKTRLIKGELWIGRVK